MTQLRDLPKRLHAIADDGEEKYPITDLTIREAAAAIATLLDVADAAEVAANMADAAWISAGLEYPMNRLRTALAALKEAK